MCLLGEIIKDEAYMNVYKTENIVSLTGRCEWSVDSAFHLDSDNCPIREASKKYNLFAEIFSEEDEFQEHYIIKCGDVAVREGFDLVRVRKDDYEDVEELNEEWETDYTEEEFDVFDDDDVIEVENHYPNGFEYTDFSIKEISSYKKGLKKENDEEKFDDDQNEDLDDEENSEVSSDSNIETNGHHAQKLFRDQFIESDISVEVSGCHYATTELGDTQDNFEKFLSAQGAIVHSSVVKKPGYLVVGKGIDHITKKLEKALELKDAGIAVHIITEDMVLSSLNNKK